ncbi:MAG: tetratricopeptide repeat protein, partial [Capsulimonadales bacterium]|nr:tetratricopeptide repeat protein [Capsulimonadales bacterium]
MTRLGSLTDRKAGEGAATAAPSRTRDGNAPEPKPRRQRLLLGGIAVAAIGLAGARLVPYIPAVQEWRLERRSLDELLKERGDVSNDPRLLYFLGRRLNEQGRFVEAESNLRRAVGLDPESARLRDEWTRAQLGSGRTSDAFNQLRQFVGTHPRSALAHLALGKFYFAQNSMQRAREEFSVAVSLDSKHAEGWAYLSQAATQLELPNEPLEAARKAVALAPDNAGYR